MRLAHAVWVALWNHQCLLGRRCKATSDDVASAFMTMALRAALKPPWRLGLFVCAFGTCVLFLGQCFEHVCPSPLNTSMGAIPDPDELANDAAGGA